MLLRNRRASLADPQHPRTTTPEGESTNSSRVGRTWEAIISQRILVVFDSAGDQRLLRWLRRVLGGPPADLHFLSVHSPPSGVAAGERQVAYAHQVEETVRAQTLARMSPAAARLSDEGFRVATEVRFGDTSATVLRTAAELGAGLIVLAVAEGRGWRRWRERRVEHEILRRATVPVLAVRRHSQRAA